MVPGWQSLSRARASVRVKREGYKHVYVCVPFYVDTYTYRSKEGEMGVVGGDPWRISIGRTTERYRQIKSNRWLKGMCASTRLLFFHPSLPNHLFYGVESHPFAPSSESSFHPLNLCFVLSFGSCCFFLLSSTKELRGTGNGLKEKAGVCSGV